MQLGKKYKTSNNCSIQLNDQCGESLLAGPTC